MTHPKFNPNQQELYVDKDNQVRQVPGGTARPLEFYDDPEAKEPRLAVRYTGALTWGPGGATPTDLRLERGDAHRLALGEGDGLDSDGAWGAGHLGLGTGRFWRDLDGWLRWNAVPGGTGFDGRVVQPLYVSGASPVLPAGTYDRGQALWRSDAAGSASPGFVVTAEGTVNPLTLGTLKAKITSGGLITFDQTPPAVIKPGRYVLIGAAGPFRLLTVDPDTKTATAAATGGSITPITAFTSVTWAAPTIRPMAVLG